MYERIAVALDGSEIAESALSHVSLLAERLDAEVVIVRVVHTVTELVRKSLPAMPSTGVITADAVAMVESLEEKTEAERYLKEACRTMRGKGLRVSTILREGPFAEEIVGAAIQHGCDLIVITAYGGGGAHTPRDANVFGGVADQVLRTSTLPVLVVRPWAEISHE